jgi:hypothetical protein
LQDLSDAFSMVVRLPDHAVIGQPGARMGSVGDHRGHEIPLLSSIEGEQGGAVDCMRGWPCGRCKCTVEIAFSFQQPVTSANRGRVLPFILAACWRDLNGQNRRGKDVGYVAGGRHRYGALGAPTLAGGGGPPACRPPRSTWRDRASYSRCRALWLGVRMALGRSSP